MKVRDMTFKKALSGQPFLVVFPCLLFLMLFAAQAFAVSSVKDISRKDYWINKYGEAKESPLSTRAQRVFERVLAASDRRAGLEPELHIIDYNGKPWAQSLADGSVILTKNAVDFCYANRTPEEGDSRLAFVIGHELAHQFNGDFWHYRFLRTAEGDKDGMQTFQVIKDLAKNPDTFVAKEIQADQYGIIYSTLAGYSSEDIISDDGNFFIEWAQKESPDMHSDTDLELFSEKRVKAVSMRLKEVSDRIVLFQMGVISYHLGRYDDALTLFSRFASYFPGREVYSNIGTIYLQKAYEKFLSSRSPGSFPFLLSFGIDIQTRAETIDVARGFDEGKYKEYKHLVEMAIKNLKKAVEYDPFYLEAKNSLGCAYILENEYYDAVSILEEALNSDPNNIKVQNNLSVAYVLLGEKIGSDNLREKARKMLKSAKDYDNKAGRNWNSLLYLDGEIISQDNNSIIMGRSIMDLIQIDFNPYSKYKTNMKVPDQKKLKKIDDYSSETSGEIKIFEEYGKQIFLLSREGKIRMVLYKSPSGLKTNVTGSEITEIYISNTGRKGIMVSKNTLPDYFEF